MGECGRFFGVTAAAIHWQLNERIELRPYKGYFLKYSDDQRPWPDAQQTYAKACIDGTKVIVTEIVTGVVEIYDSMEAVGRKLGCSASSILYQLRKEIPTPYRGYTIRYG
jgi:hypothetical protein